MQCPKCGQEMTPRENRCPACGGELATVYTRKAVWQSGPISVSTHVETHLYCGGCGAEVPVGEKACPKCGHAMLSMEEIQATFQKVRPTVFSTKTTSTTQLPLKSLTCPHCGKLLEIINGKCKDCGQPAALPEAVQEALTKALAARVKNPVVVGPARVQFSVKIGSKGLGVLAFIAGLLALLASPKPLSLHGPFTPWHFAGIALLVAAAALIFAGKSED